MELSSGAACCGHSARPIAQGPRFAAYYVCKVYVSFVSGFRLDAPEWFRRFGGVSALGGGGSREPKKGSKYGALISGLTNY